jgi:cell wall-associated NlpC family hydrolase
MNRQIASYAMAFPGRYPYSSGGSYPATGFDCSGLTHYMYGHFGYTIGTTAQAQYSQFRRISLGSALPGDLVFFHDGSGYVFHVGIYEGGNMMVAAATPQDGIRYQTIWSSAVTYGTILH